MSAELTPSQHILKLGEIMTNRNGNSSEKRDSITVDDTIVESKPHIHDKELLNFAAEELTDFARHMANLEATSGPFDDEEDDIVDFNSGQVQALMGEAPAPEAVSDTSETETEVDFKVEPAPDLSAGLSGQSESVSDADEALEKMLDEDPAPESDLDQRHSAKPIQSDLDDVLPGSSQDDQEDDLMAEMTEMAATSRSNPEQVSPAEDDLEQMLSGSSGNNTSYEKPLDDEFLADFPNEVFGVDDPQNARVTSMGLGEDLMDDTPAAYTAPPADLDDQNSAQGTGAGDVDDTIDASRSPFALLFQAADETQPVTDQGLSTEDQTDEELGIEDNGGFPAESEDDLHGYLDELMPNDIPVQVNDDIKLKSLPGADAIDDMDVYPQDDLNVFQDEADLDYESQSGSVEEDHLPQLVMGGDEFSIPGSEYNNDEVSRSAPSGSVKQREEEELGMAEKDGNTEDVDLTSEMGDGDDLASMLGDVDESSQESELDSLIDRAINDDTSDDDAPIDEQDVEDYYTDMDAENVANNQAAEAGETEIEDVPVEASEQDLSDLFGDGAASQEDAEDEDVTPEADEAAPAAKKTNAKLMMGVAAAAVLAIAGGAGFMLMGSGSDTPVPPVDKSASVITPIGGSMDPIDPAPFAPVDLQDTTALASQEDLLSPKGADEILTPVAAEDVLTAIDLDPVEEDLNRSLDDLMGLIDDETQDVGISDAPAVKKDLVEEPEAQPIIISGEPLELKATETPDPTLPLGEDVPVQSNDTVDAIDDDIMNDLADLEAAAGGEEEINTLTEEEIRTLFVEEERVIEVEGRIDDLVKDLGRATDGLMAMSRQIEKMETAQKEAMARMTSTQRQVQGYATVFADFAAIQESLEQTQSVLLDVASRVNGLENANPASQANVDRSLNQLRGEIDRLAANMAVISRMALDGKAILEPAGGTAGKAVTTAPRALPSEGDDKVFSSNTPDKPSEKMGVVPKDVKKKDFVEGYGYVLDIVPASGNRSLVIMENGSVLINK